MKKTRVLITEMENLIFSINPHLKRLKTPNITVGEYYRRIFEYKVNTDVFPESNVLKKVIFDEVEGLYGTEKAMKNLECLNEHFIAETATHFSFPRSFDNIFGVNFDSNLTWNSYLTSVAMSKLYKQKVHFGIYTTAITFDTVNSPSILEINPYNYTKIHNCKESDNYVRYSQIDGNKINTCINELKVKAKSILIDKLEIASKKEKSSLIYALIQHVKNPNMDVDNYKAISQQVCDQYQYLESSIIEYLRSMEQIKKIPDFIRQETDCFHKTVLLHKFLLDDLINSELSGIEQITVSCDIAVKFLVIQLKDSNSFLYKLFNNPKLLSKFVDNLSDIRSGWKKVVHDNEMVETSPFLNARVIKNHIRLEPNIFRPEEHHPDALISKLEKGEIYPTIVMIIIIYMTAGLLPVGGMLQSLYAKDIQNKLCAFLKDFDKIRDEEISKMPLDISLHVTAFECKEDMNLYNYSELKNMRDSMSRILKKIPDINLQLSYYNALPTLYNFFVYYVLPHTHPGYKRLVMNIEKKDFLDSLKIN